MFLFAAISASADGQEPLGTSDTTTTQQTSPGNDESRELAKKLSNPVSSLISVPFQSNFDFGMGSGSGWRYTMNFQPVSFGGALRCWATSPSGGPENCGFRFIVTPLFPR